MNTRLFVWVVADTTPFARRARQLPHELKRHAVVVKEVYLALATDRELHRSGG
jgi:hypothetical protein